MKSGAPWLLSKAGLWRPLMHLRRAYAQWRHGTFSVDSRKWRFAIQKDMDSWRTTVEPIGSQLPQPYLGKTALMISSFSTVWGVKLESVLSMALRLRGYKVIVLDFGGADWLHPYHLAAGISDIRTFEGAIPLNPSGLDIINNDDILDDDFTINRLMDLSYRGVDVGRIALSNLLYRRKFVKFDLQEPALQPEVNEELRTVRRNVRQAERFIQAVNPDEAFVLEKGMTPSAEVFGACIANGVSVIQYVNSQHEDGFVLKRYNMHNRRTHPFSLDSASWQTARSMLWGPEQETEIMQELEAGYRLGNWFNRKYLHDGKHIQEKEAVQESLSLDPSKKTAVVFSHVLWDATFFYGDGLFPDYETWLIETVKAACANPCVNWVVKLHPDLVWKLKYENYSGELRDVASIRNSVNQLPAHVRIVMPDTDISTYSFFTVTDYCVTVRGTIGIEMAAHGIPVLTAGTGRYSHLGFTLDSETAREYLDRLKNIQYVPAVSEEQIELARRFAFMLFRVRPFKLSSFSTERRPLVDATDPLNPNLIPHVSSFRRFVEAPDINQFGDWQVSGNVDFLSNVATST